MLTEEEENPYAKYWFEKERSAERTTGGGKGNRKILYMEGIICENFYEAINGKKD